MTIAIAQLAEQQDLVPIDPRAIDPNRVADLRRRIDRRVADLLVARAEWIAPDERALVLAIYRDGARLNDLAAVAPFNAKTLREHLRRAVVRMLSPRFAFVLRERAQWSPLRRRIADECVLRGLSMRRTALELGLSLHAVRRHMDSISAMESAREQERAA